MLAEWPLRSLYYFSLRGNLLSLMKRGILSKKEVRKQGISAGSFAEESVQSRRRNVDVLLTSYDKIPLHDLVPLYLVPKTPALSARRERREELVFIDVSPDVLCDPGNEFAFTDGNAASTQTQFFRSLHRLDKIPWDVIQAEYWPDYPDGKRRRCAEFLVYPSVTPRYFSRLVVVSPNAAEVCASLLRRAPNQSSSDQIGIAVEPGNTSSSELLAVPSDSLPSSSIGPKRTFQAGCPVLLNPSAWRGMR